MVGSTKSFVIGDAKFKNLLSFQGSIHYRQNQKNLLTFLNNIEDGGLSNRRIAVANHQIVTKFSPHETARVALFEYIHG
jgi:hypothetical protein